MYTRMFFLSFVRRCSTQIEKQLSPEIHKGATIYENGVQPDYFKEPSVLDPSTEDLPNAAPYLKPSFNFAAYVNKSETLQQLVKLGVDLHRIENRKDSKLVPFVLGLDFENNIKNHVLFLSDLGLENEELGGFITKNPWIFKESLDDLAVRINYMKSKKFTNNMILRIIKNNPYWLSFSTQRIDKCLGYFQKHFSLSGAEVRTLAAKNSKLITYDLEKVKVNTFVIKEEMGFSDVEVRRILLSCPKLFLKNQNLLLKTFEYCHHKMNISLERILEEPKVLTCRETRLQQRHLFLEKMGRLQLDPKKPNYVSLIAIVAGSDASFATEVAGSSIQEFNIFLKSL